MTVLPTRKDEAFRYADIASLGEVWDTLSPPEKLTIAAQQKVQQMWLPSDEDISIRRAELTLEAGAEAVIYALNSARRYARIELDVTLREGARFTFNGANVGNGTATLEIVTTVRHTEPNASSRQMVRSVLGGTATGAYLGKVAVARGADGTDAVQSIKAMLLTPGAHANAKPELEIFADDVKCAHGATVGELDPMQLYYAAARGLPPADAKALLLDGFVGGLWDAIGADSDIARAASAALRAVTA